MTCNKCGKEGDSESKFCVYCGNEMQKSQPEPQQPFQNWKTPINPIIRQKVEEDKKNRRIKALNTLVNFSSIMWLIIGILSNILSLTALACTVIYREKFFELKTVGDSLVIAKNYSSVAFIISQF